MEKNRNDLGDGLKSRLSAFLLNVHPMNTAKLVARDANCSADTAYKWIEGTAFPTRPDHLANLTFAYGERFVAAVFGPIVTDHLTFREARLEQQRKQIERDLQAIQEARRRRSNSA